MAHDTDKLLIPKWWPTKKLKSVEYFNLFLFSSDMASVVIVHRLHLTRRQQRRRLILYLAE